MCSVSPDHDTSILFPFISFSPFPEYQQVCISNREDTQKQSVFKWSPPQKNVFLLVQGVYPPSPLIFCVSSLDFLLVNNFDELTGFGGEGRSGNMLAFVILPCSKHCDYQFLEHPKLKKTIFFQAGQFHEEDKIAYNVCLEKGSDQLIGTLSIYILSNYPFVHNQLIRTFFEAHIVLYSTLFQCMLGVGAHLYILINNSIIII